MRTDIKVIRGKRHYSNTVAYTCGLQLEQLDDSTVSLFGLGIVVPPPLSLRLARHTEVYTERL